MMSIIAIAEDLARNKVLPRAAAWEKSRSMAASEIREAINAIELDQSGSALGTAASAWITHLWEESCESWPRQISHLPLA
jgi:hypothetical protein